MAVKFRDYYEVLGVARDASQDEIRKAFRKLARTHHPDVAKDKTNAEEKFKEINEAYEVLGDVEKRKKYDQLGRNWQQGGDFPYGGGAGAGAGGFDFWQTRGDEDEGGAYHFEGTGFSDFFETFFGSRRSQGGFTSRAAGGRSNTPRKGRDIESEILVSLDEVMNGSERRLAIQPAQGSKGEKQTVTIRIPRGIAEGQMIRAAGLGEPGVAGGAPGDLFLRVHLERHPDFRVDGHDLYYELRLAPWEAVLGAKVPVRTPHGTMHIKVPTGAESGTEFRLSGKGLPKGKDGGYGDLFAVAEIVAPTKATEEEARHWKALSEISKFNPR